MPEEALLKEIAVGKKDLVRLVSSGAGLDDPIVLAKSREIDDLVVRYYRIVLGRKAAQNQAGVSALGAGPASPTC
jgi:hypothetical protein